MRSPPLAVDVALDEAIRRRRLRRGRVKRFWASIGTERGPKITVPLLRWRQSHGAMNAPLHKPCCAFRAWASSSTYALEYLTKANA
jgi:hypothetical protein